MTQETANSLLSEILGELLSLAVADGEIELYDHILDEGPEGVWDFILALPSAHMRMEMSPARQYAIWENERLVVFAHSDLSFTMAKGWAKFDRLDCLEDLAEFYDPQPRYVVSRAALALLNLWLELGRPLDIETILLGCALRGTGAA